MPPKGAIAPTRLAPPPPLTREVAANQLSELLLTFPSAVSNGVPWLVLARAYQERYRAKLDLEVLGFASPLTGVTSLLWDVLRIVDQTDASNPVLRIQDGVALSPQAGLLACWPSLYRAICEVVVEHGLIERGDAEGGTGEPTFCLLLANLKRLLEHSWHAKVDETTLGYRNEEGTFIRLKKMKHLLREVLKWREERLAWQQDQGARRTAVDEALVINLALAPAHKNNDLLLRCSGVPVSALAAHCGKGSRKQANVLKLEVERLLAENERLRDQNEALRLQDSSSAASSPDASPKLRQEQPAQRPRLRTEQIAQSDRLLEQPSQRQQRRTIHHVPELTPYPETDLFDDPYEPPPELSRWSADFDDFQASISLPCTLSLCVSPSSAGQASWSFSPSRPLFSACRSYDLDEADWTRSGAPCWSVTKSTNTRSSRASTRLPSAWDFDDFDAVGNSVSSSSTFHRGWTVRRRSSGKAPNA